MFDVVEEFYALAAQTVAAKNWHKFANSLAEQFDHMPLAVYHALADEDQPQRIRSDD